METGIPELISRSNDPSLFEIDDSSMMANDDNDNLTVLTSWELMGTANENSHKVIN